MSKTKLDATMNVKKFSWKSFISLVVTFIIGLIGGGALINITSDGQITVTPNSTIELSPEQVPAIIETEDGTEEIIEAPTVESIDGNQLLNEDGDYGRGEYHDTSTPQNYKNATLNKCIDVDGHYGSQCFDLANDFWQNYAGRFLSSCGTGAAKGTLNCAEKNASDDFIMIYDANQLQAGDWLVFTNGRYGHIGMALGQPNNGYIALLGENQGGAKCEGGGSSTNVINISLKNFGGAFRPVSYIKEEPKEPEAPKDNTVKYIYKKGDTFGQVIKDLGLETERGLWGKNGDVVFYTKQLIAQDMLDQNGNVKIGVEFVLTLSPYI